MVRKHWLTILLVVLLCISIGIHAYYISKQSEKKADFLSRVYGSLQNINTLLDPAAGYENADSIIRAETEIRRLGDLFFYYHLYVDDRLYWNQMSFDQLAFTLSSKSGNLDGLRISGILEDGVISDAEKNYLRALYDDFHSLMKEMEGEKPNQADLSVSIGQINQYFDAFFSRWNTRSADTPFKILMSE